MKHPEAAAFAAYLDGELDARVREDVAGHLAMCATCRDRTRELTESRAAFAQALEALDVPAPDVDRALRDVRARLSAERKARTGRSPGVWQRPLARAAAVILAFGALASGLPGSPVREWLRERTLPNPGAAPPVAATVADPGVRIEAADGRVRVSVSGLAEGGEVIVRAGAGSLVSVFAGDGARFATDAGRVLVTEAGPSVTVELPGAIRDAVVEVEGVVVYRRAGDRVDVPSGSRNVDGEVRVRP